MEDETMNFFAVLIPFALFIWILIKGTLSALGGLFGFDESSGGSGGQDKKKGVDTKGIVSVGQSAINNMHNDADSKIKSRVK